MARTRKRGRMKKLKWICIAIFFLFAIAFITSFIPDTAIRHGISSLLGFISGFVCMDKYLSEEQ